MYCLTPINSKPIRHPGSGNNDISIPEISVLSRTVAPKIIVIFFYGRVRNITAVLRPKILSLIA